MGNLGSRINRLEEKAKALPWDDKKQDPVFRNYIVTRKEFDHLAWGYYAICQQPEIGLGIKSQFGDEVYDSCVKRRNEDIQALGELANKPIKWFLEMFLEHILEYPHKIDFDLKDIGDHARREIEDAKRAAQFYPEDKRPAIPEESDFSLAHYIPIVRECRYIEYDFSD